MPNLVKLGRKAVKTDSRTLKLSPYMKTLPPPPPSVDWTKGVTSWGMMLNDTYGCCTIAGCGHAVQVWGLNSGYTFAGETLPDSTILSYYEKWDGYVNGDASTDNGGIELDVIKYWKAQGFGGHHLLGFADPTVSNHTEIMQAINLFGGVYIGMNVPNYIMNQNPIPEFWQVPFPSDDASIDGGHCVFVCGYNSSDVIFISWGQVYRMEWAYWDMFVDEAHALLGATWIKNSVAPQGLNLAQLQADIAQIR